MCSKVTRLHLAPEVFLRLAEVTSNKSQHVSTGMTPYFVNLARHLRVPALLCGSIQGGNKDKFSAPNTSENNYKRRSQYHKRLCEHTFAEEERYRDATVVASPLAECLREH